MVELHAVDGRLVRNGDRYIFLAYSAEELDDIRRQGFENRVTKLDQRLKYYEPWNILFNSVVLVPAVAYTYCVWMLFLSSKQNYFDFYSNIQLFVDAYSSNFFTLDFVSQVGFIAGNFALLLMIIILLKEIFFYCAWLSGYVTTRQLAELNIGANDDL